MISSFPFPASPSIPLCEAWLKRRRSSWGGTNKLANSLLLPRHVFLPLSSMAVYKLNWMLTMKSTHTAAVINIPTPGGSMFEAAMPLKGSSTPSKEVLTV